MQGMSMETERAYAWMEVVRAYGCMHACTQGRPYADIESSDGDES